jgi:hypothetical protein
LVNEAAWQGLMEQLRVPDAKRPRGYRAVVTCYNGQTVHTLSGVQSVLVTGIGPKEVGDKPPTADEAKGPAPAPQVAYRPELSVLQEGAALQITPVATVSGKFVVVDVHSRVAHLEECAGGRDQPAESPGKGTAVSPQELVGVIDRPRLMVDRLSTTLRVPVDRLILVGGMTQAVDADQGGSGELYLFLRVSVQELRDDVTRREAPVEVKVKPVVQPKRAPGLKPKLVPQPGEKPELRENSKSVRKKPAQGDRAE